MHNQGAPILVEGKRHHHRLRLRSDLRWKQIHSPQGALWIAIHPWTSEQFRCSADEYFLLRNLKNAPSIEELEDLFHRNHRPHRIHRATIEAILQKGLRLGLVHPVAHSPDPTDQPMQRFDGEVAHSLPMSSHQAGYVRDISRTIIAFCRWFVSVFQLKIPLGDPSPLLKKLQGPSHFLFGPFGWTVLGCLSILGVGMVLIRWEAFVRQLPGWDLLRSPRLWIGYGIVFFATRIIHELGHALACVRYRVRVREFGLLGSFGMLCPYVNISESWQCPRPYQRVTIALGGMILEGWLAVLAAIVWGFTTPGGIHAAAYQVMLVCSATTFLFNANPLIKYDGYYVLSDWLGIQNLRERSWESFDGLWDGKLGENSTRTLLLSLYFLLSVLNRTMLLLGVGWFVVHLAADWKVMGIGIGLLTFYAVCQILLSISRWKQPASSYSSAVRIQWMGWAAVFLLGTYAITSPLPNYVYAKGSIRTDETKPIFAPEQGRVSLISRVNSLEVVQAGAPLLHLKNLSLQKEYNRLKARWVVAVSDLEGAKRASFHDSQALNSIPHLESILQLLESELSELHSRMGNLVIESPRSGVLRLASQSPSPRSSVAPNGARGKSSRLFSELQDGEFVEKGALLGWVENQQSSFVECLLNESEIAKLQIGMRARVRSMHSPSRLLSARVIEIASTAMEGDSEKRVEVAEPLFMVRLSLEVPLDESHSDATAEVLFSCTGESLLDKGINLFLRQARLR